MHPQIRINSRTAIPLEEVELEAVRAQGPGGQNVNKVSTAIHLRFDICASSLPESYKARLLRASDRRITSAGVIVLKAQRYRSQEKNRADALDRLVELITRYTAIAKPRKSTKPTRAAKEKRLHKKQKRGRLKALRSRAGASDD